VIGYGNTLRQDDGVGPYVAEQVAELGLPGVLTLVATQLSPEHAEMLSNAQVVVFVDAVLRSSSEVQLRPLEPSGSSQVTTHAVEPGTLLALSRDLFGRAPLAWWLTIPAERLGFGEEFSPQAWLGVEAAVGEITHLFRTRIDP
jgi:hydrogenase maturation protease